jgi:hypothetical protein
MDWEALAEAMIPVVGRLYRDNVRHYVGMQENTLAHNVPRGLGYERGVHNQDESDSGGRRR